MAKKNKKNQKKQKKKESSAASSSQSSASSSRASSNADLPKASLLSAGAKGLSSEPSPLKQSSIPVKNLLKADEPGGADRYLQPSPRTSPSRVNDALSKSIPKSLPKAIPARSSPAKPATPSQLFQSASLAQAATQAKRRVSQSLAVGSYSSTRSRTESMASHLEHENQSHVAEKAVNMIVSEHLVQSEDESQPVFGSVSHSLLGGLLFNLGATTREIYKWKEERDNTNRRPRRNSEPDLIVPQSPSIPRASELREPGMFRRQFIMNRARSQGKPQPNFVTRNFIDFIVLFGFFGGDVYPSDLEDDSDFEADIEHVDGPGLGISQVNDIENPTETTPLVARQRTSSTNRVKGTSPSKAFFMLVKAFVGTGVLFLPVFDLM